MADRLATIGTIPASRARARPRHPRQVAIERFLTALLERAEKGFAVVGLFLFTSALIPLLLEQSGVDVTRSASNPVLRATYSALHAVTLLLLVVHWRAVMRAVRRNTATLALLALALVSAAWSVEPAFSARRALAFIATSGFGLWLVTRYDTRAILRLLAIALGAAAALSVVFALALPSYGVDTGVHAGRWRGIFPQKNTLAQTMALGVLVFALYRPVSGAGRIARWTGLGLCLALVLLSTSKTALGVVLACAALGALYRTLRWRRTLAVPIVIAATVASGAVGVWLLANSEDVLVTAGKDPTLTGRTPLWMAVVDMIAARPVTGYGYSGFWMGWRTPSLPVHERIGWNTPHAHNGFLDIALQLGLVGLTLFLVGLGVALARSAAAVRTDPAREALWPLLMLTFVLLYNITETTLLQHNSIYWILFVAAVFAPVAAPGSEPGRAPAAPGYGP